MTAMDFRQYDQALGRFTVMDIFSEMAYEQTPYRYGFNNPVFWQDATGLFETDALARTYAFVLGISTNDYYVTNNINGGYNLVVTGGQFDGTTFYDYSELLDTVEIKSNGGGSNSSSSNKSNSKFWKFWERGGMFQVWGVMKESLGFKKNSRKRSAVDVSMSYDEIHDGNKTSLMKGANFWKRLKEGIDGAESRALNSWDRLNTTEADNNVYFQYKTFVPTRPSYTDLPFKATSIMRDTNMMESQRNNFNAQWKSVIDSIRAVEEAKKLNEKYNLK